MKAIIFGVLGVCMYAASASYSGQSPATCQDTVSGSVEKATFAFAETVITGKKVVDVVFIGDHRGDDHRGYFLEGSSVIIDGKEDTLANLKKLKKVCSVTFKQLVPNGKCGSKEGLPTFASIDVKTKK